MTNPAATSDIEARWRPLTTAETTVANTRLTDGWRDLRRLIPDLESRMNGDADLTATAVQVLADAVIKILRNIGAPDGVRRRTVAVDDGSTSLEFEQAQSATIEFTDEDLAKLSAGKVGRARAFSLTPS